MITAVIANLGMIIPERNYNILLQTMEEIKLEQKKKKLWGGWDIKSRSVVLHLIVLNLNFWHDFQRRHPTPHQLSVCVCVCLPSHKFYCKKGLAQDSSDGAISISAHHFSVRNNLCHFLRITIRTVEYDNSTIQYNKVTSGVDSWLKCIMEVWMGACKCLS